MESTSAGGAPWGRGGREVDTRRVGERRIARGAGVLAIASLSLFPAGCATLGLHDLQPLRIGAADRASTVRLIAPSGDYPSGAAAIRIWAEVENPNPFGVALSELEGRLHVEDRPGPRATFPLGLPLEAGQDTVIPLDLTLAFEDVPDMADAVRSAILRGAVDYRMEGSFTVEAGRFGRARFGPHDLLMGELRVTR